LAAGVRDLKTGRRPAVFKKGFGMSKVQDQINESEVDPAELLAAEEKTQTNGFYTRMKRP
jgi:hypothetical protein